MDHRPPIALLALLALLACNGAAPDLILVGRVWTGDSTRPWAEGFAIEGDSIAAVGDSAEILALAGAGTEVVRGAMVVPGFRDDHTHFFWGGFQLTSVDLKDAATPEEFIRRIAAHAKTLPRGEWIQGGTWDHELWPGTPLPRKEWIDSVTPDHPVFVGRYDGHMSLANSLALRLAGVDRTTVDVPGGEIVRGPPRLARPLPDGEPTGVFKDAAQSLVQRVIPAPSPERMDSALARALRHAATLGVTGISLVSANWDEVAAFRRARARGALTLRTSVYIAIENWRSAAESLRVNGPGDQWLRVAGVKGFVDGSLGSTTAWFYDPYVDAPQTTGLVVTGLDSLRSWIARSDSAGLQVVVHAIGDRANDWLLGVFDSVATSNGSRDRRFRIEHAQHLRREDIPRFAALTVVPSMQPYHAIDDGRWAEKRIGPERIKTTYAFRSLLDAGARLAFGSDWTVAPLDPMQGVYAAVTRRTLDGKNPKGWVPEEKITVEEALRAYTVANAWGTYAEGYTGTIRPGFKADIAVLDQDLTAIPPEQIGAAKVVLTVVGGRVVYRR